MKPRFLPVAILAGAFFFSPRILPAESPLPHTGVRKGIVCLVGLPQNNPELVVGFARENEFQIFVQCSDPAKSRALKEAAEKAKFLGSRIFSVTGSFQSLKLADNIADAVIVNEAGPLKKEILRVLHPRASAWREGKKILTKAVPDGIDEWTHPYHGPDNNPNSRDQLVKGRFRTQFIAEPKFSPMPEQTVIGGGRIYKAMGNIAHKANQNPMLNTLLCVNAYNGVILWKRDLPKGFMIHRNTMIATDDGLLMGDAQSCKLFDGVNGKIRGEITIPPDITDGQTWKWMAKRGDTLFALVGNPEVMVETQKSIRRGLGHWPWGMWKGHDYKDPRTSFGYGRTLLAYDLKAKKIKWHYRDDEFLDARAVCMNDDFIYCFSSEHFLLCIDKSTGKLAWRNTDGDLLKAVGKNGPAQHYITGYATTSYMKCSNDYLFFAGPQREKMVVASAKDGNLAWTYPRGNLQLVLRDDGVWAAGAQNSDGGVKLDYATGKVLSQIPARRACTRATGSADSIFFRASGGTVRILTETNTSRHIAPMRPPCQDGVLISNGQLYWGPWMCGCQLSLYGNISLAPVPADSQPPSPDEIYRNALTVFSGKAGGKRGDVPGDSAPPIPGKPSLAWSRQLGSGDLLTAPVTGGGRVFVADRNGVVQSFDTGGHLIWKNYADGAVYFSPVLSDGRLFVGSGDGKVYAFSGETGELLWTFRVGPGTRLIPVFGKLISSWPLSGGVVVDRDTDTLYAAGGITHYDGTFVVALDAASGKLKASNTTSGTLSSEVDSGISLQGRLRISDGELQFLGGGVYETARYDLKSLACLNSPKVGITSQFRTAFYPYYPDYGKYVSLEYTCDDGSVLCHDSNYAGYLYSPLRLEEPSADGTPRVRKDAAREFLRRRGKATLPRTRWRDQNQRRFTAFHVSGNSLLATGHPDDKPQEPFLLALNIKDGKDIWKERLPSVAVKDGIAMDRAGRIFVALENGQLLCFSKP